MSSPTDSPKYWNAEKERVIQGVEILSTPTQLSDILGTYVWVFSGDPEFGGDVVADYYSDDPDFVEHHSITITTDKPEKEVSPDSVKGCITWGSCKITYKALQPATNKSPQDASDAYIESCWEVVFNGEGEDEASGEDWLREDSNVVYVAKVVDDNGNPFVVFDWAHPEGGYCSWSGYYLGKKMETGKDWRLTDQERDKLGIGYSFEQMEEKITGECKTNYSDDEQDDELSVDGEGKDEDEDSEWGKEETNEDIDEEENEEDGGEAPVKTNLGEKRKVRGNDLGANKRRRDK